MFTAAVLAALEEDLKTDITDHFDLIVGTSTGGIIALGLGLGLRPFELVDFYATKGKKIFSKMYGGRSVLQWAFRKYPQSDLRSALQEVLEDKKLGDSTKRLVIPSYNLGDDDVYLFKTPHHERLRRDWKVPAWQVALATSAAPTYFPASRHIDHIRHIDGGIWANNPTMVGIIEAKDMLGVDLTNISVLNIGTSDPISRRPERLDWLGKLGWASTAPQLIMRSQSLGVYTQSIHLIGKENVVRLDPKVPDGLFDLDKAKRIVDLKAKAAYESRNFAPTFEREFLGHRAAPYTPNYPKAISGGEE